MCKAGKSVLTLRNRRRGIAVAALPHIALCITIAAKDH
jgi:hypothetical protein